MEVSGGDVALPCHLSPETSAVAMEIRWFNGTDCIYLYKNGHVTVREAYEGRVSVKTQELQRGDVSMTLRKRRNGDTGVYTCQVISGEHKEEGRVGLSPCKSPVPLLSIRSQAYLRVCVCVCPVSPPYMHVCVPVCRVCH